MDNTYVTIVKLMPEQIETLRVKVNEGQATELERLMYYSTYNMGDMGLDETVRSWL